MTEVRWLTMRHVMWGLQRTKAPKVGFYVRGISGVLKTLVFIYFHIYLKKCFIIRSDSPMNTVFPWPGGACLGCFARPLGNQCRHPDAGGWAQKYQKLSRSYQQSASSTLWVIPLSKWYLNISLYHPKLDQTAVLPMGLETVKLRHILSANTLLGQLRCLVQSERQTMMWPLWT